MKSMYQRAGTRRSATLTPSLACWWPLPAAAVVDPKLLSWLSCTIVSSTRREAEDGVRPAVSSHVISSSNPPPLVCWYMGYQMVP